ncbi:hypothetical protein [Mycolicibacterium mageritense]
MKIVVAGGTGLIGARVVSILVRHGHDSIADWPAENTPAAIR